MVKKLLSFSVVMSAVLAAGCGGSGNTLTDPGSGGGGGGGGGTPPVITVELGTGVPPAFQAGMIGIAVPVLAAGGSTSLSVSLVTSQGAFFTEETNVVFSSACIAQGLATVSSPVTTSTGIATTTYSAIGCSGDDVITAQAVVNGATLSANGTVNVAPSVVGSVEFVSATPEKIGLKGTGGVGLSETATVVFKVVDATGGPVPNQAVTFGLDTSVGGISLAPATAVSGADGRVQTTVQSGTVATSVRVSAVVDSLGIGTQSSQLIVTTGLPDQDSFSLSMQCPNVEAFNHDGVINPVTVRLADRFNNPVPDGTAVTFTTGGGQIGGGCSTMTTAEESGVCSVNWISSEPRPINGRVSILATALGEESFVDFNGNGFFDDADTFTDLAEPFRDDNEDGVWNPGEFFLDFDGSGSYSEGDGLFSGLLCGGPDGSLDTLGRCSDKATMAISAKGVIVMSGSEAVIQVLDGGVPVPADQTVVLTAPTTVTFVISDLRGQPMPAGTTVSIETTNGQIVGPNEYTVPCTAFNGPMQFPFFITSDGTPSSGQVVVTVETPRELVTLAFITLED